jgi:hypothetical protein
MGNNLKSFNSKKYIGNGFVEAFLPLDISKLYYKDNQNQIEIKTIENKKEETKYTFDILTIRKLLPETYSGIKKVMESGLGYLIKQDNRNWLKCYYDNDVLFYELINFSERIENVKKYYCENLDEFNSKGYSFFFVWDNSDCELFELYSKELNEYNLKLSREFEEEMNDKMKNLKSSLKNSVFTKEINLELLKNNLDDEKHNDFEKVN